MSEIFNSIPISEEVKIRVDDFFQTQKEMKKVKVEILKPIGGFGYHTGQEGIIDEDRIEALEQGGYIRTLPLSPTTTKKAKEKIIRSKK